MLLDYGFTEDLTILQKWNFEISQTEGVLGVLNFLQLQIGILSKNREVRIKILLC